MKLNKIPVSLCIYTIKFYQNFLSPHLRNRGVRCRFYPTCSNYGILAIQKYGVFKVSEKHGIGSTVAVLGIWKVVLTIRKL